MLAFPPSRRDAPTSKRLSDIDPRAELQLTIVLRPGTPIPDHVHMRGGWMSREDYRARHATKAASIQGFADFASGFGLALVGADAGAHTLKLRGTYAQAIAAFQPDEIGIYEDGSGGRMVARGGHLHLPASLHADVVAIMGFDQRPVARPHFRHAAAGGDTSYTPTQVASAYDFPSGLTGAGQTIALIELGGGYKPADMAAYFSAAGIARAGTLSSIAVDGAANMPGDPSGPDGEVQLDIEVAGAIAPAANLAVYFAPNQGSGFHDAISAAVNDARRDPAIISISWGGPESSYAAQDLAAIDQALNQAVALGITVCVASGDNGAGDGGASGTHVDFPASSLYVLGCGGTSLPRGGAEVAWNDGAAGGASGGGYSTQFPRPSWQIGVSGSQRGVPDVSGDADPATGYGVSIDGQASVIGGTSAVAPLWAGLLARINQAIGTRAGFINPTLYANPSAFVDILAGNNGAYEAGPGWDPVTGLGRPIGSQILAILSRPVA